MKFTSQEISAASAFNMELIAKHEMALAADYDIVLPVPPSPVAIKLSQRALIGNWGYDFLKINTVKNVLLKTKPKRNILYCVVDTMANCQHDSLNKYYAGSQYCKDYTDDDNSIDYHGHGHHVAGSILGVHPNGYPLGIGVLPAISHSDLIICQKGLNRNGAGRTQWLIDAITEGYNVWINHFKNKNYLLVYNFSWGSSSENPEITKVINYVVSKGAFVFAAAGNDGVGEIGWPARHINCISVGAHDSQGIKADFSQWGAQLDMIAPGVDIWSCFKDNNTYVRWDGTSMATPHATAAMGWILKFYPEIESNIQLLKFINENATDGGDVGVDNEYGYGYPILDKMLANIKADPTIDPQPTPVPIKKGKFWRWLRKIFQMS